MYVLSRSSLLVTQAPSQPRPVRSRFSVVFPHKYKRREERCVTILKTAARETIDTWNNFNSITRTLVVWVVSESQEVMVFGRMILGTPSLLSSVLF